MGEPDGDLLELATTLIAKKTAPFHPEAFHDRYVDALHRLIDRKAKDHHRVLEDVAEPGGSEEHGRHGNVLDLMAALRKSVDEGAKAPVPSKTAKPAARKVAGAKSPRRRKAG